MDKVIVGGSLIPSTVDTPLDKRSRVATFAEIANIENPARYIIKNAPISEIGMASTGMSVVRHERRNRKIMMITRMNAS